MADFSAWYRSARAGAAECGIRHDISHSIAIPQPRAKPQQIQGLDGPRLQLSVTDVPGDALALASVLDTLITTILGWTPVANDGGAALKSAITSAFAGFVTSGSVRTKVDQ
jgi:hypothetical protein